jgi:hypothetical protein
MPDPLDDTSRGQIQARLLNVVVAVVAFVGLTFFTPARWNFDIHDPDFFPLNPLLPGLLVYGAYQALRAGLVWRRQQRQGSGQVQIDGPARLRPGERLAGRWTPGRPGQAGSQVQLRLQCVDLYVEEYPDSVADARRRYPQVAWEGCFEGAWPPADEAMHFEFKLPTGLKRLRGFIEPSPPGRVRRQSMAVLRLPFTPPVVKVSADMLPSERVWRLQVQAQQDGRRHEAEFELPIEVAAPGDGQRRR